MLTSLGEKGIFVNFNIDSKISLHSRALFFRYHVVGQIRGYHIALSDFKNWLLTTTKNNNFIEFKVHLIHSKQVHLLHNAVLIYAMKELD